MPTPHAVADIREAFLAYFARQGHQRVPSHSLLPPADPTLLFVNAGMVQFKDYFTGARPAPYKTATSTQKCLRVSGKHNDLENVGRTRRHHTLFEMLGNFSFGDYFKEGAIRHAWRFLTEDLGLDRDRLVVTYFGGNDAVPADLEARALWQEIAGLPEDRIVPMGEKDNFWAMGDTGPCGPCTEIYWDLDPRSQSHLTADDGRYMEIWNCVFMQYDRQGGVLTPLPAPCVDTGMGLERIASVVQGAASNYDTDLFLDLVRVTEELSGQRYGGRFDPENVVSRTPEIERDVAFRVIADHARATAFLMAEAIFPDSEGRGYVLRRIMRRAIRYGRVLGMTEPFLFRVTDKVIDLLAPVFPELAAQRDVIARVTRQEEDKFGQTYEEGLRLLEAEMARIEAAGEARTVPGQVVFFLHDSKGFPTDLTALIAGERNFALDMPGFDAAMAAQKQRGKASWKKAGSDLAGLWKELADEGLATDFLGYEHDEADARALAVVIDGERVDAAPSGSEAWLVLDRTPFYGEGGGQVGDQGEVAWAGEGLARVTDTQKSAQGLFVHKLTIERGTLRSGAAVRAVVDGERRASVRAHHSATHLLHKALRDVLGPHVKQRGSLVQPKRLRFDFAHFEALTAAQIVEIERHVAKRVLHNDAAHVQHTNMDGAQQLGALAFFGDKYGDVVRVMQLADSVELCGGTHVARTGDIGLLKIVSEGPVSAGVRRIEAVCHLAAVEWLQQQSATLTEVARRLNATPEQVPERLERLADALKAAQQEAAAWQHKALHAAPAAVDEQQCGSVKAQFRVAEGVDAAGLRSLADQARDQLGSGVVGLLSPQPDGKALWLVAVTKDLTTKVQAGAVVAQTAPILGGRGGGRPDMAQAGGQAPADAKVLRDAFFAAVAEVC